MEDIMITETGRAKAIYDEQNDRWEVSIFANERSDLRKVHDEIKDYCLSNNMRFGILQQKSIVRGKPEIIRVHNPYYYDDDLMEKIKHMSEGEEKQQLIRLVLRSHDEVEKPTTEWSAKCLVWRNPNE